MTPTKSEFMGLLDSMGQLQERRKLIEGLRKTYIEALEAGDTTKQAQALNDAVKEGVELFQHLPLSELREVKQIEKLASKLAENKSVLEDGKTLIALKDTNVDDMLKTLEKLRGVIGDLQNAISFAGRLSDEAETRKPQLSSLCGSLEDENRKLSDLVKEARGGLVHSRVQDALLRLDSASLKDYAQNAPKWLGAADDALQQLPTSSDERRALDSQIARARNQYEALMKLRSDPEVERKLDQIEFGLATHQTPSAEDVGWLNGLIQGIPDLPAPMVRLLAPANQAESAGSSRFGELSAAWWGEWQRIAEMKGPNAFAEKRRMLTDFSQRIEDPRQTVELAGADRDLWYLWRTRVGQAQEMVASLRPFMPSPAPNAPGFWLFQNEQEYVDGWWRIGRWLERATDEVFALLAEEWLAAYRSMCGLWDEEIVLRRTAKLSGTKRQAKIAEMRESLRPYQESESLRFSEKRERGLNLIRQMARPATKQSIRVRLSDAGSR